MQVLWRAATRVLDGVGAIAVSVGEADARRLAPREMARRGERLRERMLAEPALARLLADVGP